MSAPIRLGVLAAAGQGVRAYPRTAYTPKVLLEVAGQPLLVRNLALLRDGLGVREVVVLVGHMADQVHACLGDGSSRGVKIRYVEVRDVRAGLALGLRDARELLREPFAMILGDELYLGSNHGGLLPLPEPWEAACAVLRTDELFRIRKNYALSVEGGLITRLEEKPEVIRQPYLGCGTYFFRPSIFDAIDRTAPNARSGRVELTDAIGTLVSEGKPVRPIFLEGDYFNVNTVEDQNYANYLVRSRAFGGYRVSVVIPAWNEAGSIGAVVRDFAPHVHEVVVADNLSTDGTAEVARAAGARVSSRRLGGYGEALRHGMEQATGDVIVLTEADHSFRAKDLGKILEYMKDADMVIGTRTTRQLVEQGTNMEGVVRWANVFFGKLLQLLWVNNYTRFTDVGCTYRAIWRDVYEKIRPRLVSVGPEFSPEMTVEVLRLHRRVIEIPVSYHPRMAGESRHSASYPQLARTALRMLRLMVARRWRT